MCRMGGPEVAAIKAACIEHRLWACLSLMEFNPNGNPHNSGIVIDDPGAVALYYRKLHPWVPVEAWEPGNLGIPGIDGPRGCKLALIICHDGMFLEMARECAYKGAEIMLRTAGYTAPIRHSWQITNQTNTFQNLMVTASVCLCGSDGTFDSMGEAMFCNFDGTVMAQGGGRADEIISCEVRPDLVREARIHWAVENNLYQLGHRGYSAVKGGVPDCPYTYMRDLVEGRYRLPGRIKSCTPMALPAGSRHRRASIAAATSGQHRPKMISQARSRAPRNQKLESSRFGRHQPITTRRFVASNRPKQSSAH